MVYLTRDFHSWQLTLKKKGKNSPRDVGRVKEERPQWSFIPLYECGKLFCAAMSEDRLMTRHELSRKA